MNPGVSNYYIHSVIRTSRLFSVLVGKEPFTMKFEPSVFKFYGEPLKCLFVKRLNHALEFDRQRKAFAVYLSTHRYLDPAFAYAVFLNIYTLFVVKADTDVVLKNGFVVVLAAHVG